MRTKELLSKTALTRDEKIAHLKKLGLWREYQNEVKKSYKRRLKSISFLENVLNSNVSWKNFLYSSFVFVRTSKGHDFWMHVANYGKRPDRPRRKYKPISVYDFGFSLVGYGRYRVAYKSESEEVYTAIVTDMELIDATKNSDSPKVKDLKALKTLCITNNYL
nr:MAG TPA: hypothetical protein [Caudoviricetes sp.]